MRSHNVLWHLHKKTGMRVGKVPCYTFHQRLKGGTWFQGYTATLSWTWDQTHVSWFLVWIVTLSDVPRQMFSLLFQARPSESKSNYFERRSKWYGEQCGWLWRSQSRQLLWLLGGSSWQWHLGVRFHGGRGSVPPPGLWVSGTSLFSRGSLHFSWRGGDNAQAISSPKPALDSQQLQNAETNRCLRPFIYGASSRVLCCL